MMGMGSNPFFRSVEISFSDCPLSDKAKAFALENIDKTALDQPIAKDPEAAKNFSNAIESKDAVDSPEKGQPIQNKIDGLQREADVKADLEKAYPSEEGYDIVSEAYLRDIDGNIVKDPETREARRIDFVVVKNGQVIDSIEVTSKTANKTEQTAKENRIRDNGGNYIRDNDGNLVKIQNSVLTRIERRE